MSLKLTKSRKIALFFTILLFIPLTQSIGLARINGVDLDIQNIKYEYDTETDQMVNFEIFVKNKGTEATQSLSFKFEFGNGCGMGFMGPVIIKPGETKIFTLGSTYRESGKFVVEASVNAPEDVNIKNNLRTAIINIK